MTISSLALGAKKVIDAAWQNGTAYDLSSQAAFALESAQLLQSPGTAAEQERLRSQATDAMSDAELLRKQAEVLRARVAELEEQKAADDKVRPHRVAIANSNLHYIGKLELRIRRARVLHLKHSDSEHCQHDGEAWPCPTVAALEAAVGEAVHPCGCPKRFGRHADGCSTEAARADEAATGDTLPAWLYRRFMPDGEGWDCLDSGQREYWEHQARAVRRAVERGGCKADGITWQIAPTQALRENEPAPKCRCDEPDADPYSCEADDCTGEFSELNPFGGGPVQGHDAKVSRTCETCGWKTSVWHVADGSAEEELHRHTVRVHGGQPVAGA